MGKVLAIVGVAAVSLAVVGTALAFPSLPWHRFHKSRLDYLTMLAFVIAVMVEALRGTDDPGYLRYQLGKLMILKLREDVRQKQGAAFDLGKFHDDFLKQGAMPIKLIRRAMLGSDAPLL